MKPFRKTVRLPVVFRPLDLERRTKAQGTVMCPTRNEPVTVGACGHCEMFVRVEFDADSKAQICCAPRPVHLHLTHAIEQPSVVQDLVRVPMLSVSHDTPIAAMQPYLDLQRPWQFIPVLDDAARPVGLISNEKLRRELGASADPERTFATVMSTQFARIFPWQSIDDAATAQAGDEFRGVVVVAADGTFVGLLTEYDLSNAA